VITRDIMASIRMAIGCRNVGNFCGILCAMVGSIRFFVGPWGYADASSTEGRDGQTESGGEGKSERCASSQPEGGE
jgi:hypothetical protein